MSQVDVTKLRELEAKATNGPWYSARVDATSAAANHSQPYAMWIDGSGPRCVTVNKSQCIHADDMDFIAAMRNALPSLLDEVERLREALRDSDCVSGFTVGKCISHDVCTCAMKELLGASK